MRRATDSWFLAGSEYVSLLFSHLHRRSFARSVAADRSRRSARRARCRKPRMSRSTPRAASRGCDVMRQPSDLIYVTGGCDGTCVVSYPDGEIVGSLDVGFGLNSGVCSDSRGNVYIADNSTTSSTTNSAVVEYTHGGTTPIATFDLPGTTLRGAPSIQRAEI